ncbi:hypothetical protein JXA27_07005 [Aerococcaceae bacterium zg-B36]|uniref:hypothetical protein n=1 Tax=Aerococcaceae bacterium zg-252 TaxID=2796928 RepID=UPI001BD8B247|nr:hypothetical protein [Aerococcaceae bacterium zg-B36]
MQGLQKLAKELYENKTLVYNEVSGQDAMRKLFYEALDVPVGTKGIDLFYAFQRNKHNVFQLISVTTDAIVPALLKNEFDGLAEFHNFEIGDTFKFKVRNKDLFRVATIAAGTKDLRRQTKLDSEYTVETDWLAASIYAEWEQFLTGQLDWADWIDTLAASFTNKISANIYNAITMSYDGLRTTLKHSATGRFDLEKVEELARRVRAASGVQKVTVYGTVSALSALAGTNLEKSDGMKDELNNLGYLKTVRGLDLVALPDAYEAGTENFVVSDKTLLLVPSNEKIVDVALEGETYTIEDQSENNNGLQIAFQTRKKVGVQVKKASVYGFYKLT